MNSSEDNYSRLEEGWRKGFSTVMPHVNSGGSSSATTAGAGNGGADDFASNDEVKVYKDEGDEEQRSSENLSEDKLGLVTETEEVSDSFWLYKIFPSL